MWGIDAEACNSAQSRGVAGMKHRIVALGGTLTVSSTPEGGTEVRAFAGPHLAAGHDAVVLGHFHVERDLDAGPAYPGRRILVLPEWKGSRRHLRVSATGDVAFVDS